MGNSVINIEMESSQFTETRNESLSESDKVTEVLSYDDNHITKKTKIDPTISKTSGSLDRRQLTAMMKRQWIFKKRAPGQLVAEILSPMAMMLLLVLGWTQSEVEHYDAANYANVKLPLLDELQPVFDDPNAYIEQCLASATIQQSAAISPADMLKIASWIAEFRGGKFQNTNTSLSSFLGTKEAPATIAKDIFQDKDALAAFMGIVKECIDLRDASIMLLNTLLTYNGPAPIPSFDVFVSTHKILEVILRSKIENFPKTNFPNKDLRGSPYKNVSSPTECRRMCESNPKCNAFSFSVLSEKYSGCWLKKQGDSAYHDEQFYSGLVYRGNSNLVSQRMHQIQMAFGHALGNLLFLGKISFAPNSTGVQSLVTHLRTTSLYFEEYYAGTFASEKEAVSAAMESETPMWAVVVVDSMDPLAGKVDYTIRMNYTSVPRTYRIFRKWFRGISTAYRNYYTSGFLSLQEAINGYVFTNVSAPVEPSMFSERPVWGLPFPTPNYSHNRFYDAVGPLIGLVMCLSTLYPLGMLVKGIVEEKETKSRETILIMGLKPWIWSLSWLLTYLVVFGLVSLSITVLLTSTFLKHSSFSLIFVCFMLFTASLIPFGFLIAVFFNKSKIAAFTAPFLHFAAIMPRYIFFRSSSDQAIPWKTLASLLPPTAFTFGIDLIGQYEGINEGLTWSNFTEDDFSMARVFLLLILDFFLFSLLAWYLEKVLPSEYGTHLPPWFIFKRSYWLNLEDSTPAPGPTKYDRVASEESMADSSIQESLEEEEKDENSEREPSSNLLPVALKIRKLRKVFPGGKLAVSGLNLDVFEGQITALLGHNGAGKSTTISMLTGLVIPTSGEAFFWGKRLRTDLQSIRRLIGVCPQQNVLFPKMTVMEHLQLYCDLKGVPQAAMDAECVAMVQKLGFSDKLHSLASDLSGGMKRKLQVAIAMIGGSRLVFLDEPTSGMDPQARRGMWELLRGLKDGRAIVLTTHYMDEADLLCDRIAILGEGRLRACGTSLFLKAKFGVGYNLTMVRDPSAEWSVPAVQQIIQRHVSTASTMSSAGGELAVRLPFAKKQAFAALFADLEQRKSSLGIAGYGVSMTTLEEVFLRLASDADVGPASHGSVSSGAKAAEVAMLDSLPESVAAGECESDHLLVRGAVEDVEANGEGRKMGGSRKVRSFGRAWTEMIRKRFIIARRDIKGLLNSILLPVAVIAFVMLILKLEISPAGPALPLNLSLLTQAVKQTPLQPAAMLLPVAGVNASQLHSMNMSVVSPVEVNGVNDSSAMSKYLLDSIPHSPPRFVALVFHDVVLQNYNFSNLRYLNISSKLSTFNVSKLSQPGGLQSLNVSKYIDSLKANLTSLTSFLPALLNASSFNVSALNSALFQPVNSTAAQLMAGSLASAVAGAEKQLRSSPVLRNDSGMGLNAALTLLHNTSTDHSLPCLLQEMAQARFQLSLSRANQSEGASAALIARVHPLPLTQTESKKYEAILAVLASLFVLIPFCYLAGTFAVFTVRERTTKAKHLQLVSGAGLVAYWGASYVWDLLVYLLVVAVSMAVFVVYRDKAFIGNLAKASGAALLLCLFGTSAIPLSYVYSFAFQNHANAQVAVAGFHFVSGFVTVIASLIMGGTPKTRDLNNVLVVVYRVFPSFNLGEGLISLSKLDLRSSYTGQPVSPFKWTALGRPCLLMLLQSLAYFALTLAVDSGLFLSLAALLPRRRSPGSEGRGDADVEEDADVAAERVRVESGLAGGDAVLVRNLRKVYPASGRSPAKVAVADLCVGIPSHQCFGFLGVNGAGKTTTMAMLTGDHRVTGGDALVGGKSVRSDLPAVHQLIGYCPQFDPLLDLMTAREHLAMFARLKGVPEEAVASTVSECIAEVGLQKYADACAGTYSGGNKRKLSLAIALIGSPEAVFLDEPSSGMDPVSRRAMWGAITRSARTGGASVLLSSHSMEECEALCGRVGVMRAGRLVCLGPIQHLKNRFGQGYFVELRSGSEEERQLERICLFMAETFPGSVLEERHMGRVSFRIPLEGLSLARVFGEIERQREALGIEDYSVSQSSLEQVFLSFAKGREGDA